jgi:hypothetical protein
MLCLGKKVILCQKKSENLYEMDKFLERPKLPKLIQELTGNLNRPTTM